MKIGFLQFKPKLLDIHSNLKKIENFIGNVKADLIVLPELATTGYLFCNKKEVEKVSVDALKSETSQFFKRLSQRNDCSYVVGIAEKSKNGDLYNSAILTNPNGEIFVYRKTHLFYEEKLWFKPGNTGFNVFKIKNNVKVGIMICFDWIFPESARTLAIKGAQIIAHPSNLVLPWCQKAMFARSLENKVFSITANRIGTEKRCNKKLSFTGKSQVLSVIGDTLIAANESQETLKLVEINPTEAENKNINDFNNLFKDRRKDLYI